MPLWFQLSAEFLDRAVQSLAKLGEALDTFQVAIPELETAQDFGEQLVGVLCRLSTGLFPGETSQCSQAR